MTYSGFLLFYAAGTVMTPNYVRSLGISLSPWCDCSSSGNSKPDCDKFAEFFTNNRCLREFPYSVILQKQISPEPDTLLLNWFEIYQLYCLDLNCSKSGR